MFKVVRKKRYNLGRFLEKNGQKNEESYGEVACGDILPWVDLNAEDMLGADSDLDLEGNTSASPTNIWVISKVSIRTRFSV